VQNSHDFYKFGLVSKAFETVKWFCERESERYNKKEFVQALKKDRVVASALQALRDNRTRMRWLRHKQTQVTDLHRKSTFRRYFLTWAKQHYKASLKQPSREIINRFYQRSLRKRSLRILYNYRSFRIVKNCMKDNAESLRRGVVKRQVYNRLLNHYFKNKLKVSRRQVADQFFKKVVMNRWMGAKLRVQRIRGEIILSSQVTDFESSYKHLNTNLRKSL
jgi:hypothetical protein